jgi:putative adhesin
MRSRFVTAIPLLLIAAATSAAQRPVERRMQLDADGSVRITNLVGSVRVNGWDRDSLVIRGTVSKGDQFFAGGGHSGAKGFVEAADQRNPGPSHLEVFAPRKAKIWIKTATADVTVSGIQGQLDLYVVGGTIRVSGNPSEVNAEAIDGSIEVNASPAWLRAKSASGSVTLKGTSRDMRLSSVTGGINVSGGRFERAKLETVAGPVRFIGDIEPAGTLDIDTHSGSVELTFPPKVSADLEIVTIAGAIRNSLGSRKPVPGRYGRGAELNGSIGNGGARISVRTFKGNITLSSDTSKK